jgi:serine/threonine protein kinase
MYRRRKRREHQRRFLLGQEGGATDEYPGPFAEMLQVEKDVRYPFLSDMMVAPKTTNPMLTTTGVALDTEGDGSKLLGSGSFGCVYFPGRKCTNPSKYPNQTRYVTKILSEEDGKTEYDTYTSLQLSKIDPEQFFFVHDVEICNLKKQTRDSCTREIFGMKNMMALNYMYAGTSLDDLWGDPMKRYTTKSKNMGRFLFMCEVLVKLPSILCGIEFLYRSGVVHNDIAMANMMMDDKGRVRIIDFGAALSFPKCTIAQAVAKLEDDNGSRYRRFLPDLLCIFEEFQSGSTGRSELKKGIVGDTIPWIKKYAQRAYKRASVFPALEKFDLYCFSYLKEMDSWPQRILKDASVLARSIRMLGGKHNVMIYNTVTQNYFQYCDTYALGAGILKRVGNMEVVEALFQKMGQDRGSKFLLDLASFFFPLIHHTYSDRISALEALETYKTDIFDPWASELHALYSAARKKAN